MPMNILSPKTEPSKLIDEDKGDQILNRIGIAKGKLESPDDLDQYNEELAQLMQEPEDTFYAT